MKYALHDILYRAEKMYTALYELSVAEDNIWPEKYILAEGEYPRIRDFPAQHPNRKLDENSVIDKDEL